MRRPSARCIPHTATLIYNAWKTDDDGGLQIDSVKTRRVPGVPCFVQPGGGKRIVDTTDSNGLRQSIELNPTNIFFVTDVKLRVDDLIQWVDQSGVTHYFAVISYTKPCGTQYHFCASTQERD